MNNTTTTDDSTVRVFLIDDHSMVRAGMRSLVDGFDGFRVVGDHGDSREAVNLIDKQQPDLVLLDISMPGLSGIDAIHPIRGVCRNAKILMLSHHEGESFVEQALRHGADGYLSKDSAPEELGLAMRSVMRGLAYLSPRVASGLVNSARMGNEGPRPGQRLESLTPREREVFQLLALGFSNKEVARKLDTSVGTAKKHRENLQRKLDCHSPAHITRLAIREGLLEE